MASYYDISGKRRSILGYISMTWIIILVNIFAFIISYLLITFKVIPLGSIALTPLNIVQGRDIWTFLTSMFMHAGFFHLFFNMISLFFVGMVVERIIGRKRYLWFYIISGLVAGLFFVFLSYLFGNSIVGAKIFGDPSISGVGASGAIFGLVGLLAMLIPSKKIYLIAGPLLAIILQAIIDQLYPLGAFSTIINLLITIYIFISIFSMFSFNNSTRRISLPLALPFWLLPVVAIVPLIIIGLFVSLPIANTAHLGGLLAGLVYGAYLRNKYKRKTQYLNKVFS